MLASSLLAGGMSWTQATTATFDVPFAEKRKLWPALYEKREAQLQSFSRMCGARAFSEASFSALVKPVPSTVSRTTWPFLRL